jgi:hypothetical protein
MNMSEKTIAEQFEDEYNPITTCMSSVKNAIERIERRLSALETAIMCVDSRVDRLDNEFDNHYHDGDTVMLKWDNASALEGKPKEAGEWMTGDTPIWMAFIPYGKTNWAVRRGILAEVAANDLWMPYDPEHPEPPAPPEVK